ncbi:hypothetical protein AMECASPLE_017147 [Ameca splendens]|uniref:Uncharacterized protein n=1 Tax=Ameca splendens TaxID=208324 RepID=A0ABV0YPP8_9TELE
MMFSSVGHQILTAAQACKDEAPATQNANVSESITKRFLFFLIAHSPYCLPIPTDQLNSNASCDVTDQSTHIAELIFFFSLGYLFKMLYFVNSCVKLHTLLLSCVFVVGVHWLIIKNTPLSSIFKPLCVCCSCAPQGKGQVHRLTYHASSPPGSPRLTFRTDAAREESGGEEGAESLIDISEHQQAAMQQEDRVLMEQIESLQKKKEELTVEMLALEPRASDDETLESEASIGTADSSENLNVDSEETISDFSERGARMSSPRPPRSDGKDTRRRAQHQQSDSLDSADSCSTVSSYSSSSHFHPSPSSSATSRRFRFHSKSPAVGSSPARSLAQPLDASHSSRSDSFDGSPTGEQDIAYDERPLFTSRGTYNPEKGKQKLKGARHSGGRNVRDGGGDPPDISQHLVLYGSNEFMV